MTRNTHTPTLDELHTEFVERLDSLADGHLDHRSVTEVRDLHRCLESLPLPMGEFSTARNRLLNVERYLETSESGAALYELRLLLTTVCRDSSEGRPPRIGQSRPNHARGPADSLVASAAPAT